MSIASSFSKYSRRRLPNPLTRAWLTLLALSLASAVLTMLPAPPTLPAAGILILALVKARIILARYLELAKSSAWLRGFTTVLIAFTTLIFGLYLI